MVERLNANRLIAKDNIRRARADQKYYADRNRTHAELKEGDLVILKAASFRVYRRSGQAENWRARYLGPLMVKELMGPVTYRVEIPPSVKRAHNVFHASKLKRFHRRENGSGPLNVIIDVDGREEQDVAEVLDK